MAFWDTVKKVAGSAAKTAVNQMQDYAEEANNSRDKWYDRYSRMDRDELKREHQKFKNGQISASGASGAGRRQAFKDVCEEKGYYHGS